MPIVLLIVIAFLAGLTCGLLYTTASDIDERITRLEEAQVTRLTPKAAAAVDDSLSAIINAGRLHQAMQADADALKYWLDQAAQFGRGVRGEAPYDPDQPTGNFRRK